MVGCLSERVDYPGQAQAALLRSVRARARVHADTWGSVSHAPAADRVVYLINFVLAVTYPLLLLFSNEAKSVAGNHWLRLSPSVALLRGQVWSSLGIRCQQQQLVD